MMFLYKLSSYSYEKSWSNSLYMSTVSTLESCYGSSKNSTNTIKNYSYSYSRGLYRSVK